MSVLCALVPPAGSTAVRADGSLYLDLQWDRVLGDLPDLAGCTLGAQPFRHARRGNPSFAIETTLRGSWPRAYLLHSTSLLLGPGKARRAMPYGRLAYGRWWQGGDSANLVTFAIGVRVGVFREWFLRGDVGIELLAYDGPSIPGALGPVAQAGGLPLSLRLERYYSLW